LGHYDFTVSTFSSPEPDYDVTFWQEYLIQPTRVTYRGKHNDRQSEASVLLDSIGDNQAKIFFKHPRYQWRSGLNYCELSHYKTNSSNQTLNIPKDLLDFKLRNISISHSKLRAEILQQSGGGHPVQFISKAIQDVATLEKIKIQISPDFEQFPVMLWNRDGGILVMQKWHKNRRYVQYFNINTPHCDNNELNLQVSDQLDILKMNKIVTPNTWYLESDVLNLLKHHDFPVVFTHLMTIFNLHPDLSVKQISKDDLDQEIPDIVLYSHRGFNFNSGVKTQSDTGHFHRRNSKVLARYSELNKPLFYSRENGLAARALFMKDIAPAVIYNSIETLDHPAWLKAWDDLIPYLR
jgi:hypothetical protein